MGCSGSPSRIRSPPWRGRRYLERGFDAESHVGVLHRGRVETLLAAGPLDTEPHAHLLSPAVIEDGITLEDIFMGPLPLIADDAARPVVSLVMKPCGEGKPFGQFHFDICAAVMVDVGHVILELGLRPAVRQPALIMVPHPDLHPRGCAPFEMRADRPEIGVALREGLVVAAQAVSSR